MTTQDDLEQQLWDYIYGLLEPAEARALEERITSEHDVARAYAETRLRADMLATAARVNSTPIKLNVPTEVVPAYHAPVVVAQRSGLERGLLWFLSSAALMLVGLIGYGQWKHAGQQGAAHLAKIEQQLASDFRRVIVTGPAKVQPEIDNLYTVQLQDLNGEAACESEYCYTLENSAGDVVAQATANTDTYGNGTIAIDGTQVADEARLKVWCKPTGKEASVELPLARGEADFETYFTFNKNTYRPGEDAYVRTVTLPVLGSAKTRDFLLRCEVATEAEEAAPMVATGVTDSGVGNGKVTLDDQLVKSRSYLSAQLENGDYLSLALPIAGQQNGVDFPQQRPTLEQGNATIRSGDSPPNVRLWAEDGVLVAGLDNKILLDANTATGSPAQLRGVVVDSRAKKVAEVATTVYGRGEFLLNPRPDETYRFVPTDTNSSAVPLPAVTQDVTAKLFVEEDTVAAGAPLQVDVTTTQVPAQLLVAASRGDATISQQFVDFDDSLSCPASKQVTLPLVDEVAGALAVTLYDVQQSPPRAIGERVVMRQPAQYLQLTLAERSSGDRWDVQVVDEARRPCAAVLGVNVVAEEQAPQGLNGGTLFAHWYAVPRLNSWSDVDGQAHASLKYTFSAALPDEPAERWNLQRQTQLGLPFLAAGNTALLGDGPTATAPAPPMLRDNLAAVEAAYQRAVTDWRDTQQDRLHTMALVACLGSGLLLLTVSMLLILRAVDRPVAWIPATVVAAGAFAISCAWMGLRIDPATTIAVRPIKPYDGAPLQLASATASPQHVLRSTAGGRFGATEDVTNRPVDLSLGRGSAPSDPATPREAPPVDGHAEHPTPSDDPLPDPPSSIASSDAPAEPYFGIGGFGGGGGGLSGVEGIGMGPRSGQPSSRRGLLDRIATNDYYSLDLSQQGEGAAVNSPALHSPLAEVALNYQEYRKLPIQRYAVNTPAPQPTTTPAPPDDSAIFWDPLVKTNEQGEAELRFRLPASGRFRITIDAHGNGRLGSLQQVIERTPSTTFSVPAEKP